MKRVVYTCLFGHSELFNDFTYERDGIDFICFTDDPELRSDFWKIELLPRKILDPARAAVVLLQSSRRQSLGRRATSPSPKESQFASLPKNWMCAQKTC